MKPDAPDAGAAPDRLCRAARAPLAVLARFLFKLLLTPLEGLEKRFNVFALLFDFLRTRIQICSVRFERLFAEVKLFLPLLQFQIRAFLFGRELLLLRRTIGQGLLFAVELASLVLQLRARLSRFLFEFLLSFQEGREGRFDVFLLFVEFLRTRIQICPVRFERLFADVELFLPLLQFLIGVFLLGRELL